MRDIVTTLSTTGWEKFSVEKNEAALLEAVQRVAHQFETPLKSAGVDIVAISREFEAMLDYAVQFIALSTFDYRSSWWRLFNSPDAADWENALKPVELLFTLPASNGKVERMFSLMGLAKTEKMSSMQSATLDDL